MFTESFAMLKYKGIRPLPQSILFAINNGTLDSLSIRTTIITSRSAMRNIGHKKRETEVSLFKDMQPN
jgi:hypothetical protein